MLLWRRRTRSRRGPYTDTVFPKPGGASSFETLTADDFFQKIAGVWRHRFGERGVEYLRIDHNGNYYLERNDIEVRVFTLGNLFFNRVTHEISFDKINTGEDDPENRRKGTCLVNEVIALDSTGSTMSGHGGHDRHTVSYERLSEEPNEAAKAFFQKVAGKWHLDWGRGQEDLRIDVFGNYFLIPVGKKEVRYFTLENVVFAAKDQHVGFDKVDTGEFDSKARPKGRRLARDEVDIASDVLSMHGVDDKGRRLKYTRTRPGCSAKLL
jgi:hypothetical protein